MEVKKAVILAAGLGTRFLPITKAMPKEMLPIIDMPIIHHVVEEAALSGIDDIILITGRGKRAVEDYFDVAPELEIYLEKKKNDGLLKTIRDISSFADIHYIRQKNPRGLGDAVLRAEKHVGNEPFAVLLGDDIIRDQIPCTKQLIDIFYKYRCTVIAVQNVLKENVSKYGIVKGRNYEDSLYFIEDIIEKPKQEEAPSTLGTVGRYVFTPEIFDCIKRTSVGVEDEIQLTDAIRLLKDIQKIYAYNFQGKRYDAGDKVGYIQAIIDFALENKELRGDILKYLKMVVKE